MKVIGHTGSGKPIYAAYQFHKGFSDWTIDDHLDAADVHRRAARTDIKTNRSMHENSAALHEEDARRIQALVQKLGLASRAFASKKPRQHATRRRPAAQLDREIAEYLAARPPRQSVLGGDLSDDEYASIVQFLRRKKIPFAPYSGTIVVHGQKISSPEDAMRQLGWKPPGSRTRTTRHSASHAKKKQLRVAYRLQLTPGEMRAVEFARGRYAWPDMLAAHATEGGLVAFTEPEMWQWTDDVDSDAEGGHSPFPLASSAFAEKLQRFYDERT